MWVTMRPGNSTCHFCADSERGRYLADLDLHAAALKAGSSALQEELDKDEADGDILKRLGDKLNDVIKNYNKAATAIRKKIVL